MTLDLFGARSTIDVSGSRVTLYRLDKLDKTGAGSRLGRMPFCMKILLEAALRRADGFLVTEAHVQSIASWTPSLKNRPEIPFMPARVILQDFTGVPVVVDMAAMRAAVSRLGGKPAQINPVVPVDLVVDHSVQVDVYGRPDALVRNVKLEFERNRERYEFLRWGHKALSNFQVVPPSTGIVHQVNLEHLAKAVIRLETKDGPVGAPDTLVGTDSHTTMIGGLGVLGWGVGGIEAEAVMLGQPIYMLLPDVVGVRLEGQLRPGVTATDLTLTITERLRKHGVVDKLVEFCGPGLGALTLEDRATIANMAPEYGATCGYFPIDAETLSYLRRTGRKKEEVELCERYTKEQGLFRTTETKDPEFTSLLEVDLDAIEASVAGPKRPHDRLALGGVAQSFAASLRAPVAQDGFGVPEAKLSEHVSVKLSHGAESLGHGAIVIAAITSCTNTSNPSVMIAAGLLAKKALDRGLKVPAYVKTSLAPGSKVVTEYLRESGLLPALERAGFALVGYGCTTCIGNSGPLDEPVAAAITKHCLVAAAVLSGNRNFEGRVHPLVRANYLASPPLVVAYAFAGTVTRDLVHEPLGTDKDGRPVYLRDVWPTPEEIVQVAQRSITPQMFEQVYAHVFRGGPEWEHAGGEATALDLYTFNPDSTYIREPPFFADFSLEPPPIRPIRDARALAVFGDSITTDHISPAGDIAATGPAAQYLMAHGLKKADFNSYGSRRGNHEVMMRGTFANIRIKNRLVPGTEGGVTIHLPSGGQMSIFDAAQRYRTENVPLIILAGKEYGSGSSRDWAAKGPMLLGVRAVLAESFERIHRSNLVGMGILPLQYLPGENLESLGLSGRESFSIELPQTLSPCASIEITVLSDDSKTRKLAVLARLDSPVEVSYYQNGGILPAVLRMLLRGNSASKGSPDQRRGPSPSPSPRGGEGIGES